MISAVIMAHPKRSQIVKRLERRLKIPVVWDQKNDIWDTGRRALLAHTDASHHLVLQDDALTHPSLLAECERIIENTPGDVPISLYMGKARHRPKYSMKPIVMAGRKRGASFAVFGGPWWGVGIIVPTIHIPLIVKWGDRGTHRNYDIRIAQFYKSMGIDCWYTLPSIVEHRVGESLVGRKGKSRNAVWHEMGMGFDWSGGTITPADLNLNGRFPKTP